MRSVIRTEKMQPLRMAMMFNNQRSAPVLGVMLKSGETRVLSPRGRAAWSPGDFAALFSMIHLVCQAAERLETVGNATRLLTSSIPEESQGDPNLAVLLFHGIRTSAASGFYNSDAGRLLWQPVLGESSFEVKSFSMASPTIVELVTYNPMALAGAIAILTGIYRKTHKYVTYDSRLNQLDLESKQMQQEETYKSLQKSIGLHSVEALFQSEPFSLESIEVKPGRD